MANVPDYQKMLQSRYPSSGTGWSSSSSQLSGYSSYTSRHAGGSFLNPRHRHYPDSTSPPRSSYVPYQPHRYGLATDSYPSATTTLDGEFRAIDLEDTYNSVAPDRNGFDHSTAYNRRDYDVPSYRSDVTRTTDYSSDSGANYRRSRRRSNEFELERPALSSKSQQSLSNNVYTGVSPVKSNLSASDYTRYNGQSRDTVTSNNEASQPRDHDRDRHELGFVSPPLYTGNFDLTQWQKQQKEKLSGDDEDAEVNQIHTTRRLNSGDENKHDTALPWQHREQLEELKSAADGIIRDKDAIIEKLKRQNLAQEEAINKYEGQMRRNMMNGTHQHTQDAESYSKLQDLEYRNSEMKNELTELKMQKEAEVEELEHKLGATEHEVDELKSALRKCQPNNLELKNKFKQKEEESDEWRGKFMELKKAHMSLKQKLVELERYMSQLPSQDEFSKNTEELASLNEENLMKSEQIVDLEERLNETTQLLAEREITIQELEGKQQLLADRMAGLTEEIRRIKSEGEGAALQQSQQELHQVREERERLALDLEKAKKLLEVNHRRNRQLEVKNGNEVRQLKERLGQEEESVMALREEGRRSEQQILKLKKSLKEFAGKNQDLMDDSLILKEQLKQMEEASADDNQQLERRFVKEMAVCFQELQSVVQICVQRAEGKEPNISLLLGSKASREDEEEDGAVSGKREEQTLKQWFSKLKELRNDVEQVRQKICDIFATELGENTCAIQ